MIVVKLNVLNLSMNWIFFFINRFQGEGLKFDTQQTARHKVTLVI